MRARICRVPHSVAPFANEWESRTAHLVVATEEFSFQTEGYTACAVPTGLLAINNSDPGLTSWATFVAPCGLNSSRCVPHHRHFPSFVLKLDTMW